MQVEAASAVVLRLLVLLVVLLILLLTLLLLFLVILLILLVLLVLTILEIFVHDGTSVYKLHHMHEYYSAKRSKIYASFKI